MSESENQKLATEAAEGAPVAAAPSPAARRSARRKAHRTPSSSSWRA